MESPQSSYVARATSESTEEYFQTRSHLAKPSARISGEASTETWLVRLPAVAVPATYSLTSANVLDATAFMNHYGLSDAVKEATVLSAASFPGGTLTSTVRVWRDRDEGSDFLRLDIHVAGLSAQAFREGRRALDRAIEKSKVMAEAMAHLVVAAQRSG